MAETTDPCGRTGERPASSGAAARILETALRPDCSLVELGKLAESDPAFALRVLSVVNSAAFGLSCQVADVRRAVGLLGVRGLRNLALGFVVTAMVPKGEVGEKLLGQALRRATASRAVAQALGERRADEAFTVGLLLECGLMSVAAEDAETAMEVASAPAPHRTVRERALGLQPHAAAGAGLMRELGLPDSIAEAIARHHDEEPPADNLGKSVWLGERLAGLFEGGFVATAEKAAREAAREAGLSDDAIDGLLVELPKQVAEGASAYQWKVGAQVSLEALMRDANQALVEMNLQYESTVRTLEALIAEKEALTKELAAANERLAALASTDPLTALPNKRTLLEAMARDLAQADREHTPVSVIFVDVDHFKQFNDTWGHATGDEVLRVVGELLKGSLRQGDLPARYGGEEFVVVLPHTDSEGAMLVAERIRARLEAQEVDGPEGKLHVTASFGVATVTGPGVKDATEDLLGRADAALYVAKENGRNRVALAGEAQAA